MSPNGLSQTVFPCLAFRDAKASFAWLERVLGAEPVAVYEDESGKVAHAELRIGDSMIMAGDARPEGTATPPGASVIYVVIADADASYQRAKAAGADVSEPVDQEYGSRDVTITDPDGNRWVLGTYRGAAATAS